MNERLLVTIAEYDRTMDGIGGCGDGNCMVKRPLGMHTNGGCRCWRDNMTAQHVMLAARRLRAEIEKAAK